VLPAHREQEYLAAVSLFTSTRVKISKVGSHFRTVSKVLSLQLSILETLLLAGAETIGSALLEWHVLEVCITELMLEWEAVKAGSWPVDQLLLLLARAGASNVVSVVRQGLAGIVESESDDKKECQDELKQEITSLSTPSAASKHPSITPTTASSLITPATLSVPATNDPAEAPRRLREREDAVAAIEDAHSMPYREGKMKRTLKRELKST